ncbi:MAG: RsiV family protein [Ignavibacteria bacterium]
MKKLSALLLIFFILPLSIHSQTMKVVNKSFSENDKKLNYYITADYPQADFGPEALMGVRGISDDINNEIDTIVNNIISGFKNSVSEMTNHTAMNGLGSSLEIKGDASVIAGTIFSAQIKEFSAVIGMAHPNTIITSYNYCITSGGLLTDISGLFLHQSDYLKYISDYCKMDLKMNAERNGYTNINEMIETGASPDVKNFSVWNLSEDMLNITFNAYQVAPYVFGIQSVSIPLSNMTNMINPEGPLSFMFR